MDEKWPQFFSLTINIILCYVWWKYYLVAGHFISLYFATCGGVLAAPLWVRYCTIFLKCCSLHNQQTCRKKRQQMMTAIQIKKCLTWSTTSSLFSPNYTIWFWYQKLIFFLTCVVKLFEKIKWNLGEITENLARVIKNCDYSTEKQFMRSAHNFRLVFLF